MRRKERKKGEAALDKGTGSKVQGGRKKSDTLRAQVWSIDFEGDARQPEC